MSVRQNFNSKMVRLKDAVKDAILKGNLEFQFQNGTIKSQSVKGCWCIGSQISIPKWYD